MTKMKKLKLKLDAQTLRPLTAKELVLVAGGNSSLCSKDTCVRTR